MQRRFTGVGIALLVMALGGCATDNCDTRSTRMSAYCASLYGMGVRTNANTHIEDIEAQTQALRQELKIHEARARELQPRVDTAQQRLDVLANSTSALRHEAASLRQEMAGKTAELESLMQQEQEQMRKLEQLSRQQAASQAQLDEIQKLANELRQTQQTIQDIQDYLDRDLLEKAEVTLRYGG